ncbi:hypothetical protein N1030_12145 [Desulfovibrio mangrovi]|uniref:hypothetical protein n=1 Tax=Desulfovibrio mangrovi TaxID=2976983 RepID=UPI0022467609|nr:hypothetical protein [Desulfovibrio mangrovi]UZP66358.1 hypothetical protein N1030_12145 [Desulfovibrio mangrovi]
MHAAPTQQLSLHERPANHGCRQEGNSADLGRRMRGISVAPSSADPSSGAPSENASPQSTDRGEFYEASWTITTSP